MGDSTPKVKCKQNLTSKYLTPCRTFGLKRRSTPKSDILKKTKLENESSLLKENFAVSENVKTPLSNSYNTENDGTNNQLNPIKFSNISSPLSEVNKRKYAVTFVNSSPGFMKMECQITPLKHNKQIITQCKEKKAIEDKITTQIKRINEKVNRIEKLKQEEIYSKKHNLTELKNSTDKWLSTFKEIAVALHTELQARGRICTILDVLVDHNISPERVGFNIENLEFE